MPRESEDIAAYDDTPTFTTAPRRNPPWNSAEIDAAIAAYFWMLDEQAASRDFNKRAKCRELMAGPLHTRSRPSIERKMQNISAVLQNHGIGWVEGLVPLRNIQADLTAAVEDILAARGTIDRANKSDAHTQ